jgi:hypothetical protein
MPQDDARVITVDGENYRWLLKSRPTRGEGESAGEFLIAIEHEASDGQILAARFDLPSLAGLESWTVTTKDIVSLIRAGRERGWNPREAGPPFLIRGDEVVR